MKRTMLRTTVVTVALTLTAAGTPAAADSEGSAAPAWTYASDEPVSDGDVAARAVGESITRDEAERRLRADRAASDLQDLAQARWPDTFAGLWIDHDPYTVNVAFTRDATVNVTTLRSEFPYPDDLRAVDARSSLDALSILQGRLATERTALQQGRDVPGMANAIRSTRGAYDLDIDIRTGHVVVRAARPTAGLRAALAQRYGGAILVHEGLASPTACT